AAREAELGQARRIITDPEHADTVCAATSLQVLVLGGGGQPRDLGDAVVDMERIDPDLVRIPAWYQPNPGRASDLAFIVFSGEGDRTRAKRITNGRWALSAFGTASSAALSAADTVYSVTPIHHPSGLLMTMGGAIAGGARLAVAARQHRGAPRRLRRRDRPARRGARRLRARGPRRRGGDARGAGAARGHRPDGQRPARRVRPQRRLAGDQRPLPP